jgi:hypothetical protein
MHIIGIARHNGKRASMETLTEVEITKEAGLIGDIRGGGGRNHKRQVTVLSFRRWQEACKELLDLDRPSPWYARRANLLFDCHDYPGDLGENDVGRKIHFYNGSKSSAILEITGETEPCERMDEVHKGLRRALTPHWRGGVTCRVIQGGIVRICMKVEIK